MEMDKQFLENLGRGFDHDLDNLGSFIFESFVLSDEERILYDVFIRLLIKYVELSAELGTKLTDDRLLLEGFSLPTIAHDQVILALKHYYGSLVKAIEAKINLFTENEERLNGFMNMYTIFRAGFTGSAALTFAMGFSDEEPESEDEIFYREESAPTLSPEKAALLHKVGTTFANRILQLEKTKGSGWDVAKDETAKAVVIDFTDELDKVCSWLRLKPADYAMLDEIFVFLFPEYNQAENLDAVFANYCLDNYVPEA